MNNLGLYLHIPFCKRKCNYCDFYSVTDQTLRGEYVDALCVDLINRSSNCTGFTVDTLYFGGGTPSLLSCEEFQKIIATVRSYYRIDPVAEITVEVNPSSLDPKKAECYREAGVTRISIGMQTACDKELERLGRLHDRSGFEAAFQLLRSVGFQNISVDLMYGLPGQDTLDLSRSIEYLLQLSPEHVSAYCLKIEEGTPFSLNGVPEASDEEAFAQYQLLTEILTEKGYQRYEMSNFAKEGYHSRHNMKYWTGCNYLGYGPAAYSFFLCKRYGYTCDLLSYLSGQPTLTDVELIDDVERRKELIILGLRLSQGVERCLLDESKLKQFASAGYMEFDSKRAWLTTKGFFVSNSIISEFLD